jgi:hypothetical protein
MTSGLTKKPNCAKALRADGDQVVIHPGFLNTKGKLLMLEAHNTLSDDSAEMTSIKKNFLNALDIKLTNCQLATRTETGDAKFDTVRFIDCDGTSDFNVPLFQHMYAIILLGGQQREMHFRHRDTGVTLVSGVLRTGGKVWAMGNNIKNQNLVIPRLAKGNKKFTLLVVSSSSVQEPQVVVPASATQAADEDMPDVKETKAAKKSRSKKTASVTVDGATTETKPKAARKRKSPATPTPAVVGADGAETAEAPKKKRAPKKPKTEVTQDASTAAVVEGESKTKPKTARKKSVKKTASSTVAMEVEATTTTTTPKAAASKGGRKKKLNADGTPAAPAKRARKPAKAKASASTSTTSTKSDDVTSTLNTEGLGQPIASLRLPTVSGDDATDD